MYIYDQRPSGLSESGEEQLSSLRPSDRAYVPNHPSVVGLGRVAGPLPQPEKLSMRPRPFLRLDRFRFNKHSLTRRLKERIASLASDVVKSWSSPQPILAIRLIGHTDDIGGDDYNLKLGKQRADAVKKELEDAIENLRRGLAKGPTKQIAIDTDTRGKKEPLTPDRTKRELNRRVDVFVSIGVTTPTPVPPTASKKPPIDLWKLPPDVKKRLEEEGQGVVRPPYSKPMPPYFRPIPPGRPAKSPRERAREKAREYLRSKGVPDWAGEKSIDLAEKGLWSGVDQTLKSAGVGSEAREAIVGTMKAILSWSF